MTIELPSNTEKRASNAQNYPAFASISLQSVRESVGGALEHVGRLQMLEEYTKHDISHIDGMLVMYDWLIPDETRRAMTAADWLLLTLTTYLHDFGMLVTRDEFEVRESTEFPAYRARAITIVEDRPTEYQAQILSLLDDTRERFLYQEFVRTHHAERVRDSLKASPTLKFGGDTAVIDLLRDTFRKADDVFLSDVGLVCESHHLDDLDNLNKYPTSRPYGQDTQETANVQYIAVLLRTADLLHVSRERTPSIAALIVNPRNVKSQTEWAKQARVRNIRPAEPRPEESNGFIEDIEVHARFADAEAYFGLISYLQYAQSQLELSHRWIEDSS